jgi:hypothetical protein
LYAAAGAACSDPLAPSATSSSPELSALHGSLAGRAALRRAWNAAACRGTVKGPGRGLCNICERISEDDIDAVINDQRVACAFETAPGRHADRKPTEMLQVLYRIDLAIYLIRTTDCTISLGDFFPSPTISPTIFSTCGTHIFHVARISLYILCGSRRFFFFFTPAADPLAPARSSASRPLAPPLLRRLTPVQ